jgi:hypothetical protein
MSAARRRWAEFAHCDRSAPVSARIGGKLKFYRDGWAEQHCRLLTSWVSKFVARIRRKLTFYRDRWAGQRCWLLRRWVSTFWPVNLLQTSWVACICHLRVDILLCHNI